ncbi:MAG: hypothetical protein Ct9H300mP25_01400 [Acidobacteriota bacterium]|nr:MAG: hypothetical protein Ct9H300mP25_01400 [Acidobacteriota bacterium]
MDHGNPQPSQITLIRYYCAVFDNVRRVFGHLIVYGSADVAILVINVLLVFPGYTRVLTPDEFGVLALLLLPGSISSTLYTVGTRRSFSTVLLRLR